MSIGKQFRFRAFVKVNLCTKEQMKEFAEAGFKVIATGAESGSDKILKSMNKKVTVDQNSRIVEWIHEYDMYAKSIMSLGHPGESDDTLQETDEWLDKIGMDDVNFTIVECLPSSVYYDKAMYDGKVWVYEAPETGDKLYDVGIDWTEEVHFFNASPYHQYNPTVYTDYLTQSDLSDWHKYFESKFK